MTCVQQDGLMFLPEEPLAIGRRLLMLQTVGAMAAIEPVVRQPCSFSWNGQAIRVHQLELWIQRVETTGKFVTNRPEGHQWWATPPLVLLIVATCAHFRLL